MRGLARADLTPEAPVLNDEWNQITHLRRAAPSPPASGRRGQPQAVMTAAGDRLSFLFDFAEVHLHLRRPRQER